MSALTRGIFINLTLPGFEGDKNLEGSQAPEPCQHRQTVHYGTYVDDNVLWTVI